MGHAARAPDEEVREAREREQPVEDVEPVLGHAEVAQEAERQLDDDAVDGPAGLVDIREELGRHAALGHRLHGARRAEGARVGDADDRDGDDGVEDGRQDGDAGVLDGEDEGRVARVGAGRAREPLVVVGEDEAEDEEVDDVEEGDAEEDLLGGLRDRLPRVSRLGGGQADQLRAAEREGRDDEDAGEPVEAVLERAGFVPVLGTDITPITNTSAVDYYTQNDETRASSDFDHAKNELDCMIRLATWFTRLFSHRIVSFFLPSP